MMSLLSRMMTLLFKLPPAQTYHLVVERNLPVPMRDGTLLLADHYYALQRRNAPTILVRSPYGRAGIWALLFARPFAERGSSLSQNAGRRDNRALEARKDVLVYTSSILEQDIEVIGPLCAELFVQSSLEHTDFFVRLCDVDPKGKSINISDGLLRLRPGQPTVGDDGVWKVSVELWATAHCFQKGHRIRVQVAGGSHPRYARNTGSGEPLATATTLIAADHTVYHDVQHPSALILPVKS